MDALSQGNAESILRVMKGNKNMKEWKNVTESFSEEQRHYKNTYLEISEVYDGTVEVSLFSSKTDPYEIYFSYGIMYGIIYTNKEEAYAKREEIKMELQAEYQKRKEPSDEFIDAFVKKHNVCFPNDIVFDTDGVFDAFL